jgi:S1-C subfamily serine protease
MFGTWSFQHWNLFGICDLRFGAYLAARVAVCLLFLAPVARAEVKDAIVKIYTVHNRADHWNPWSMRGPQPSTGSGCVIKGRKLLTNAHVVSDQTFVQVRRNGEAKRWEAKVLEVSHDADLALLTVEDPAFFEGIPELDLGELPAPQEEVLVYGFPMGGDTLSTTKGVMSRLEHQVYSHSSCYLFAGQLDAAINPGNSGGPVVRDGRIVGVVMQGMTQADNIGYMVPVNVIRHFFEDLKDGRYDGFPSLGAILQDLENPDQKRKYRVPERQNGVLVTRILAGSPSDGPLQPGDVLTELDGHAVAEDGTVEFRPRERTSLAYYVQARQVGQSLPVVIYRGGERQALTLELNRAFQADQLVPLERYDTLPSYYIYGGFVFTPLTRDYLKIWGGNWQQAAPSSLLVFLERNFAERPGQQVVLGMKVLPHDVNQGYHNAGNWVVEEVDGKKVDNLRELIAAIEQGTGEFVTFRGANRQEYVLDRAKAAAAREGILRTYRIPADRSPDLQAP